MGSQIKWDTPYTQVAWDPYSSRDVHDKVQDARHDDNKETNLNQDDYELAIGGDTDVNEDEEDDDGNLTILLLLN